MKLTRTKDPDVICRARYTYLVRECFSKGLSKEDIRNSAKKLSQSSGEMSFLLSKAYKPTGIALGCRLPQKSDEKRLWLLSRMVDEYASKLNKQSKSSFAFVPPESYHITLVNRSHFEHTNIAMITVREKEKATDIIQKSCNKPIVVRLSGLILTYRGRLIAIGYPCENHIYDLRVQLGKKIRALRVNIPSTVHIKLGHLTSFMNRSNLRQFISWLATEGVKVNSRLVFTNFHTPHGDIEFL